LSQFLKILLSRISS